MAVFNEFSKDAEVSRKFILYNPLYNPKERYDGAELKLTRKEISALDRYESDKGKEGGEGMGEGRLILLVM